MLTMLATVRHTSATATTADNTVTMPSTYCTQVMWTNLPVVVPARRLYAWLLTSSNLNGLVAVRDDNRVSGRIGHRSGPVPCDGHVTLRRSGWSDALRNRPSPGQGGEVRVAF
ncbi:hypothetical protein GCM10023215_66180 [Pseudonocardia yuanmonensis]|uniref:Secreted protein n=1 Tax=Pseudonocardia yuanmonensis TaxID=1095914 RepID=A0ABP8XUP3_9PSEU